MRIIKFKWSKRFTAITLAPIGIVIDPKYAKDSRTLNHEKIHWQQQMERWVIPFYIQYLIEWVFKGYRRISFEQEAYDNAWNPHYLKRRKRQGLFTIYKRK